MGQTVSWRRGTWNHDIAGFRYAGFLDVGLDRIYISGLDFIQSLLQLLIDPKINLKRAQKYQPVLLEQKLFQKMKTKNEKFKTKKNTSLVFVIHLLPDSAGTR